MTLDPLRCAACDAAPGRPHAATCPENPVGQMGGPPFHRRMLDGTISHALTHLRALGDHATPQDRQLMAAIDRWRAGDLV